jgi:RNA polymerase sigma factor (TIGR02999 family)
MGSVEVLSSVVAQQIPSTKWGKACLESNADMERAAEPRFEELLEGARRGDASAEGRLWELVYGEVRKLAHARRTRMPADPFLRTTALVNEAYLKLAGSENLHCMSEAEFYAAASRAMRNVLVDAARSSARMKRSLAGQRVPLKGTESPQRDLATDLLDLDELLTRLEREDSLCARVVMLRYFGGLSIQRAACALGCSEATVERRWSFAKAWLLRELGQAR